MHPILRNILAVIAGLVVGNLLNGGLVALGPMLIPPPEGAITDTMEGLKASMHLFEPKHFLFPFLAHALGTLAGAWLTAKLAANKHLRLALLIGLFFLIGGSVMVAMLPSPLWFSILDLGVAYLPMAWLGARLSGRSR